MRRTIPLRRVYQNARDNPRVKRAIVALRSARYDREAMLLQPGSFRRMPDVRAFDSYPHQRPASKEASEELAQN